MPDNGPRAWRCTVCGYVHQGNEPPAVCPVCGAGSGDFEPYVETVAALAPPAIKQWRCLNCSYVHDGETAPEVCPICGALPDRFEPVEAVPLSGPASEAIRAVIIGGGSRGGGHTRRVPRVHDYDSLSGRHASLLPAQPDALPCR